MPDSRAEHTSKDLSIQIKVELNEFSKSAAVVIDDGLGIAKSFKKWIYLKKEFLKWNLQHVSDDTLQITVQYYHDTLVDTPLQKLIYVWNIFQPNSNINVI